LALTHIPRIDRLFAGAGELAIAAGDPDREAIGAVQDLLSGHGMRGMPSLLDAARGRYGERTRASVVEFQSRQGISPTGVVDHATMRRLVDAPAPQPLAAQSYIALALDLTWNGMTRLAGLTALFEAAGRFTAINRNTDKAGLSFGMIQWAQKPGRLAEILSIFRKTQPDRFVEVFGGGSAAVAASLVAHVEKPRGGTDRVGKSLDARFELTAEPWVTRFQAAGRDRGWQRAQIAAASDAFARSCERIRAYAPGARSERALAFLLDLANQHGDAGAESICKALLRPHVSEQELMAAVEEESVRRVRAQFGNGNEAVSTQNRRRAFRLSPLLSDGPVVWESQTEEAA
jgi:hypothetical protein